MLKKFVHTFTILFVIFGLLSFAAPASALGNKRAVRGTIVAIDTRAKTITIAPIRGANVAIKVVNSTLITRKGKPATFAKLRVGDKVNLNYFASTKQASKVEDTPGLYEIHGTVEAVDTTANTVTVASEEGGISVTLNVDTSTVIQRNGAPATLADLLVGDKVEAKYDSATMLASSIKTEVEDSDFYGTIAALDLTANTITITPESGGADVVLNVTNSTVFKKNDAVVAFADMVVGDKVEAEYDSVSMIASKIEVEH
jgi:Fe-S cluster assembly scaffold protein SufB